MKSRMNLVVTAIAGAIVWSGVVFASDAGGRALVPTESHAVMTAGTELAFTAQVNTGRRGQQRDTTLSPTGTQRRGTTDTTVMPQRERVDTLGPTGGEMQQRRRTGRITDTAAVGRADVRMTEVRPLLTATLVNENENARRRGADVLVTVQGVTLVEPPMEAMEEQPVGETTGRATGQVTGRATTGRQMNGEAEARPGQGHIHYQIGDGPVIATSSTRLSFHGLTSGQHRIKVMLVASDHTPLGPQQTLTVKIP